MLLLIINDETLVDIAVRLKAVTSATVKGSPAILSIVKVPVALPEAPAGSGIEPVELQLKSNTRAALAAPPPQEA